MSNSKVRGGKLHPHEIFPLGEDAGIKHCTKCCKDKALTEFGRDASASSGRRANCKRCAANQVVTNYRNNGGRAKQTARRAALATERYHKLSVFKDVPCADCEGRFPLVCMDFDHVRGVKMGAISRLVRAAVTWEAILAEVAKCDVVCANCHRVRTATRGGWTSPFEVRAAV